MEPSNEPILRVNRDQTALVLGGSASAPIPPCSFFSANDDSVPLHGEVVEQLASIIAPALCPSNILPRIKFSTFLYGPSGYCTLIVVSFLFTFYYLTLNWTFVQIKCWGCRMWKKNGSQACCEPSWYACGWVLLSWSDDIIRKRGICCTCGCLQRSSEVLIFLSFVISTEINSCLSS